MANEPSPQQVISPSDSQQSVDVTNSASQTQTQNFSSIDSAQLLMVTQTAANALNSAIEASATANRTEQKVNQQKEEVDAQRKRVSDLAITVEKSNSKVNNVIAAVVIALLVILISTMFFEIQFIQSTKAADDQMRQFISQSLKDAK